jgi:hypothetical protein
MIIEIQRNENEFMTIDLAKIDDDDIANEARERDYIVLEKEPFNIIYDKLSKNRDITEDVRELIYNTIGRIL